MGNENDAEETEEDGGKEENQDDVGAEKEEDEKPQTRPRPSRASIMTASSGTARGGPSKRKYLAEGSEMRSMGIPQR